MGLLASDESIVAILTLNSDTYILGKWIELILEKGSQTTKPEYLSLWKNYEPFKPAMGLLASAESIVVILALNSDMSLVNGQTKSHWHP